MRMRKGVYILRLASHLCRSVKRLGKKVTFLIDEQHAVLLLDQEKSVDAY